MGERGSTLTTVRRTTRPNTAEHPSREAPTRAGSLDCLSATEDSPTLHPSWYGSRTVMGLDKADQNAYKSRSCQAQAKAICSVSICTTPVPLIPPAA